MVDNVTPPTPEEAADDPRILVDEPVVQPLEDDGEDDEDEEDEEDLVDDEDILPDEPLDVASTDPRGPAPAG